MTPHTRATIAAAAFAYVTGKTVAGIYDHSSGQDRRIAAEFRGDRFRGFDGDRGVEIEGRLPELYDAGDKAFITFEADGPQVKGYDRGSSSFYTAEVSQGVVQVYDHDEAVWHAYDVQDGASERSYHRT